MLMAGASKAGLVAPALYRDAPLLREVWVANDAVTLLLAVPVLLVARRRASLGSARARLVWMGALHYALYDYGFYLLGAALNVLFLAYAAIVALAAWSLVLACFETDTHAVASRFRNPPARRVAAWMLFLGASLGTLWGASTSRPSSCASSRRWISPRW
jgi:hypothetical protein